MSNYLQNIIAKNLPLANPILPRSNSLFEPIKTTSLQVSKSLELEPITQVSSIEDTQIQAGESVKKVSEELSSLPMNPSPNFSSVEQEYFKQTLPSGEDMQLDLETFGILQNPSEKFSDLLPLKTLNQPPITNQIKPIENSTFPSEPSQNTKFPASRQFIDNSEEIKKLNQSLPLTETNPNKSPSAREFIHSSEEITNTNQSLLLPIAESNSHLKVPSVENQRIIPVSNLEQKTEFPPEKSPINNSQTTPKNTIQITINRIDVRAILPSPTPHQKVVKPVPKMSLDDYLRSNSGGKA